MHNYVATFYAQFDADVYKRQVHTGLADQIKERRGAHIIGVEDVAAVLVLADLCLLYTSGIVILLSILILLTLWSVLSQHIHRPAASAAESEPASSEVMVPQNQDTQIFRTFNLIFFAVLLY